MVTGSGASALWSALVGAQSQAGLLVVPDEIAQRDGAGRAFEAAEDGPEQPRPPDLTAQVAEAHAPPPPADDHGVDPQRGLGAAGEDRAVLDQPDVADLAERPPVRGHHRPVEELTQAHGAGSREGGR